VTSIGGEHLPSDGQAGVADGWKPIEMLLPMALSPREVLHRLYEQVRLNATEAGDFVHEIRVDVGHPPSDGWQRWTAAYLPGPPAPFPAVPRRTR
jgi:hypothetical protein